MTVHLAAAAGIAVRVQGMRRYYALLLCNDGKARLVKALDGDTVLAEAAFPWVLGRTYNMRMDVKGAYIEARIDGRLLFAVDDGERPLTGGGVAFVVEEGRIISEEMRVKGVVAV